MFKSYFICKKSAMFLHFFFVNKRNIVKIIYNINGIIFYEIGVLFPRRRLIFIMDTYLLLLK